MPDLGGKKQNTDEVKLLSIFQDAHKANNLYKNSLYVPQEQPKKNPMSLDPSKIQLWKEYFCRFDENKREHMSR